MQNPTNILALHPSLMRASALQAHFWAHARIAPKLPAPVATPEVNPEIDGTPPSLEDHYALCAEATAAEIEAERETAIELLDADESQREYLAELQTEAAELRATIDDCERQLSDPEFHFDARQTDELLASQADARTELDEVELIIEGLTQTL